MLLVTWGRWPLPNRCRWIGRRNDSFWIFASIFSACSLTASFQFRWQLRLMSIGVRFGSLSEACFALLLLPVLRGMALFGLCGVQFESAIRYHVWLGNATMFFSVLHGAIIMCVWGSKNSLWNEVEKLLLIHRNWGIRKLCLLLCSICFIVHLLLRLWITDYKMATDRTDKPCWGSCSIDWIGYLDNITSPIKKKKLFLLLFMPPSLRAFYPIFLASCWSWTLLLGILRSFSLRHWQNTTYHTVKGNDLRYICTSTAVQSSRIDISKRAMWIHELDQWLSCKCIRREFD